MNIKQGLRKWYLVVKYIQDEEQQPRGFINIKSSDILQIHDVFGDITGIYLWDL